MMQLDIKGLRKLYRMNNMVRYNPWPKHTTETVAAHSYYTALFTMMLCEQLKVNRLVKEAAMKIALLHDTPEIVTNDITHDAKKAMPGIDDLLLPFEQEFIKQNFPYAYDEMFGEYPLEGDNQIARVIVKIADIMSVVQYCDNEVMLGNKHFEPLLVDAERRLRKEIKKLERMGLECQKITI